MGLVGLEFDHVTQIKNLIEEVTGDYNGRVIDYLESALSRLSQLRFCSLPIHNELENCIASVYEQNRSLKEYVSQLDEYVRLVNETEDTIVEQLSNIKYDCAKPGTIPVYNVPAQHVTVANGSAITIDADAIDVAEDDSSPLDVFQGVLDVAGLIPVVGEPADFTNAAISLARGDMVNAILSAGACVPVLGIGATAAKNGRKVIKVANKYSDTVKIIGKTYKLKRVKATGKVVTKVGDVVEAARKSKKVEKGSGNAVDIVKESGKVKGRPGASKGGLDTVIKNGKITIDDIKANPDAFSGKSADEIAQMLKDAGYDVTVQASQRSSSGAKIIKINNPGGGKNITQVQVSPGGGRHGANPYVKISTSDQGIIKIVDGIEDIYKTDGKETSTIIFTGGK
jgi:filamentous hemagglutinin